MNQSRKLYQNQDWLAFSNSVKRRDGFRCLQCRRHSTEVTLQVHHEIYISGKAPWEYALSDCRTLCKGCHAREHGLIEPNRGWTLLAIDDLGGPDGVCEREGCGAAIRYANSTYHPQCGYKVVGSTCIQHLTQVDRLLSNTVIQLYNTISHFIHVSKWKAGSTKKGRAYIFATYKHHKIRIYGDEFAHSFQLVIKEKGIRWHTFGKLISAKQKNTLAVKELAFTTLRGTLSDSEEEKNLLRNLYRELKSAL